eukprot:3759964-Pyramimonas_sp.AAC.1
MGNSAVPLGLLRGTCPTRVVGWWGSGWGCGIREMILRPREVSAGIPTFMLAQFHLLRAEERVDLVREEPVVLRRDAAR